MKLFSAILSLAPVAAAAQTCIPYPDAVIILESRHSEQLVTQGIDRHGNVVEQWANPDSGTWTLIVVTPDGAACMVAAGDGLTVHQPRPNI